MHPNARKAYGRYGAVAMLWLASVARTAEPDLRVRAQALVPLEFLLAKDFTPVSVELYTSSDGVNFREAGVGSPRPHSVFYYVKQTEHQTLVGVLTGVRLSHADVHDAFLFPGPCKQYVRLRITDEYGHESEVTASVIVDTAMAADAELLRRLGSATTLGELFSHDIFDDSPEDFRSIASLPEAYAFRSAYVLANVLEATRFAEPGSIVGQQRKSLEATRTWADTLGSIASASPDSSYAPYLQYYAGCAYICCLMDENKRATGEYISSAGKSRSCFGRARAAIEAAKQAADPYLLPRCEYMLAVLEAFGDDASEVRRYIGEAEVAANHDGQLTRWITEFKRDVEKLNQKGTTATP